MSQFECIFFDLDGTLINSEEGITSGVAYVLDKFGIEHGDAKDLRKCIGPPLTYSFANFFDMDDATVAKGVDMYRDYYKEKGVYMFYVYDGISETLKRLKEGGKRIYTATSKPTPFARTALEKGGILPYFDGVYGAYFDERNTKDFILKEALDGAKVTDINTALMVGDRKFDILAAKKFSMKCAAVMYGFGSREEFIEYNADYIFDTPKELTDFILA